MGLQLNLCQWNARSLQATGRLFRKLVEETNPHIICIQESFLKPGKTPLSFTGFTQVREDRLSSAGGGLYLP